MIRRRPPEVPADPPPLRIRRERFEPTGGGVFSVFGDPTRPPEVPADPPPLRIRRERFEPTGGGVFSVFGDAQAAVSPGSNAIPVTNASAMLATMGPNPARMTSTAADPGAGTFSIGGAFWTAASALSAGASAFHGYRRNAGGAHPVAWALAWGFLGGLFPIVTPAIALAQGFGKPSRG